MKAIRYLLLAVVLVAWATSPAQARPQTKKLLTASDLLKKKGLSAAPPSCAVPSPPSGLVTATDLLRMKHLEEKKGSRSSGPAGEEDDPWDSGEDMGC